MNLLTDGPESAPLTLLLAHGAGTPMDHPFLNAVAEGIASAGIRVLRFEFPYMARHRESGKKGPPDKEPVLLQTFRDAFATVAGPVVVGGKSMGGRMASMVAGELGAAGLLVFGYPFHPPGRPEKPRVAHLANLQTPVLIIQGTSDAFGTPDDVAGYTLSPAITVHWLERAGHDLIPAGTRQQPLSESLAPVIEPAALFLNLVASSGA